MASRRSSRAPGADAALPPGSEAETSFEAALERLEGIVDRLEGGELELEEALRIFEAGVGLARRCAGQLEDAERRVEILVREGEKWLARPFEPEEVAEEAGEGD